MSREAYGVIIGLLSLAVALLPLPLFLLSVGLLSLLVSREVSIHLGIRDLSPLGFFSPLLFYGDVTLGATAVFVLSLVYGYIRWDLNSTIKAVFVLTFVGLFPSYLVRIKEGGTDTLIAFLLSVFASDVVAYYVGRRLGRRPLFPKVSPKKTVEGFVGGITAGTVVFLLLSELPILRGVLVGVLFLTVGVVGDYFKSFMKRHFGIKDFSNVLGEHGGFTDRFDALIFSAPLYYFLVVRS